MSRVATLVPAKDDEEQGNKLTLLHKRMITNAAPVSLKYTYQPSHRDETMRMMMKRKSYFINCSRCEIIRKKEKRQAVDHLKKPSELLHFIVGEMIEGFKITLIAERHNSYPHSMD